MPSWKKVIVSGSDAILNDITLSGDISGVSASFNYVSASRIEVDASTITIGGTEIDKTVADNIQNTSGTNTGDVTLSGTPDYITISNQVITRNQIDLANDVTGTLPVGNGGTGVTSMTNLKNALDDETWTFANKLTADAGIDIDNINIDGTTIALSSGDLTLDAEGDIVLDANGTDIILKDDGTAFGRFKRDSSDFVIKSETNNKDIVFRGQDGGSTITALTLDMSEGGNALFVGNISGSSVSSSGDILADGDVVAYNSSDMRLKNNLQVIEGALDKIDGINGYEFDWNDKSPGWARQRGHDVGVVAQEVQKIHPEIVEERKNGYLGVDYKRLVPLLIQSVKELKQEVEELKKKV